MYSPFVIAVKYLRYLVKASNSRGHGIHSPFVFDFIRNVLNDRTTYPDYDEIEKLRRKLESDPTPVPMEDYGAGSAVGSRSVGEITVNAAKSAKYAQLLFRIARYYHPRYILELGTSLGISTAYLASADKNALVVSGEGNYVVANLAKNNFLSLGLHNVRVVTGNFDNTLIEMVNSLPHIDLAFIDGNHREKPTLNYLNALLKKMTAESMIIFDDIHWSRGMESAWEKVRDHPSVMLTIDLFSMGIVVLRPEFKVKQHFMIRF